MACRFEGRDETMHAAGIQEGEVGQVKNDRLPGTTISSILSWSRWIVATSNSPVSTKAPVESDRTVSRPGLETDIALSPQPAASRSSNQTFLPTSSGSTPQAVATVSTRYSPRPPPAPVPGGRGSGLNIGPGSRTSTRR